ncbi:MAG: YfhO family protein [Lachnospiraceae bacterium]
MREEMMLENIRQKNENLLRQLDRGKNWLKAHENKQVRAFINKTRSYHVYMLGFLIPFFVMCIICVLCGVEPFGDKSLVIIDGLHQYMPFFSELYEKLKNGDSFFYSWNGGLGYNFITLWAYYLSSPLNFLILFGEKASLNMIVSWIIVLKISLTGLTATIYFVSRSHKYDKSILIFSTAYALCNYIIGYSWNVMWLDSIALFPIILLGFDKLVKKRDCRLYCLCLSLSLFCNFYISFMICLFLVLWFICYDFEDNREFIRSSFDFALYSILAAGIAAVVLVPAYLGITKTASANLTSLPSHEWYTNIIDILSSHLAGVAPFTNDNFNGRANLYMGIFPIILAILYFFNRKIKISQKLKKIWLLAVFMISFNEHCLNFIWHGMHDQYGIPNRFSFIYTFLLLIMAFELFKNLRFSKLYQVIIAYLLCLALLCGSYIASETPKEGYCYWITLILITLYTIILLLYMSKKVRRKILIYILTVCSVLELSINAVYGFEEIGQIDVPKFFSNTEAVEQIKEHIGSEKLERTDLASWKMLDEAIWYNLKCVTMFGSTADGNTVDQMDQIGFYTGANEYLYDGATKFTNNLLNVKYNIVRSQDRPLNDMKKGISVAENTLYENPYHTSIGYLMDSEVFNWIGDNVYPFDVLNEFVYYAYGEEDLFQYKEVSEPSLHDVTVENTNTGEYCFENTTAQVDNIVFYIDIVEETEELYIHYDGSQVENTVIAVGDKEIVSDNLSSRIYPVGKLYAGDRVEVRMQLKDDGTNSGVVRITAATLNQEVFERVTKRMEEEQFKTTSYTSNSITGTVDAPKDCMLFFSIPSDPGWEVTIDGEKVKTTTIGESFLALDVSEGHHEIEMKYISPGFVNGCIISIAAIIVFIMLSIINRKEIDFLSGKRRKRRRRRKKIRKRGDFVKNLS